MSELRWILLGCGAVLLLGILMWGRRTRGQTATGDEVAAHRVEPPMMQQATAAAMPPLDVAPAVSNRWHDEPWTSTLADLPEIRLDASPELDHPLFEQAAGEETVLPPLAPHVAATPERGGRDPSPDPVIAAPQVTDRRKIVAVRLSAESPARYAGARLRQAFEELGLRHGRYGIFHLLDGEGATLFSVASMVEPGAFDLATMADAAFAGVTLFAVLPGPRPAAALYDGLIECAQQLEQVMGGVLQDERGAPLTPRRIADLRDQVLDFEHLLGTLPRA